MAILSGAIDTLAGNYLDDNAYLIFSLSLSVIGVIGSIIIFVIYGKEMRQYHRTNRSIPDTYFGWAAPTFIIFVVANAAFRHYFVCRRDDGLSVRVRMQIGLSLKHE